MSQTRRLAAILAADVAAYSRLMGADEEGTLERLKALRRELLDPKIAEHRGRIVKTTGRHPSRARVTHAPLLRRHCKTYAPTQIRGPNGSRPRSLQAVRGLQWSSSNYSGRHGSCRE